MINFMFLGSKSNDIVEYFNRSSGGSLVIDYKYTSLVENMQSISNSNIRVDKLVIVFEDDSSFNIKQEMGCLMKLLEGNTFFRVSEILVYTEENTYCEAGLTHFKFVMHNVNFTNFKIKTYKHGITLQNLYRDTMGIIPADTERTSYNLVYRTENGETSKVGYSPRKLVATIALEERDGVSEYDKYKKNSIKTESGRLQVDIPIKEIDKIDFDLDIFNSNIDSIKNVVIFCGLPKSGTSTICSHTFLDSTNSLLLDLSNNLGSYRTITRLKDTDKLHSTVKFIDNKEMLFSVNSYIDSDLKCVKSIDRKTNLNLLKYISSIPNRLKFNTLFIDCELEELDDLIKFLQLRIKKIVFTCECVKEEFELIKNRINNISKYEKYLYMNNCIDFDNSFGGFTPLLANDSLKECTVIKGENLYHEDLSLEIFC